MAKLKDTLAVLNGLGKVAAAYSAEVSKVVGDLMSNVSTTLQTQCGLEERRGHGLPDDFPGWENFRTGEFGLGSEYASPDPTTPTSYHPPPDPRQVSPTATFNRGQRSMHTRAGYESRAVGHLIGSRLTRQISGGETVVDPTASHQTGGNTHEEQQRKVVEGERERLLPFWQSALKVL